MKTEIMMKKIIVIASILATCSMAGTLKDSRDGKTYKTVKIGNQTWMAENLNYKTDESKCYDNKESNCKKYGRLYTWEAAMKACPTGWHLPSKEEFWILLSNVGYSILSNVGSKEQGENLRAASWENGADKYGFSALPAGVDGSDSEGFVGLGRFTSFWSSTGYNRNDAYSLDIYGSNASVDYLDKLYGYSVRCLQDSNEGGEASSQRSEAQPPSGTLKDSRDGQTYKTVKIGEQVWMAENLNYKTSGSVCYDNDSANCKKYGRLYTWEAAKKVCPAGWHLPNSDEWSSLWDAVGGVGSDGSGTKLMSKNGWDDGNGSDSFGFAVLPAGGRFGSQDFLGEGVGTQFWMFHAGFEIFWVIMKDGKVFRSSSNNGSNNAWSVRCLQDPNEGDKASLRKASLSESEEKKSSIGTLKDSRDGKTYKTVKIGEQVWMAENLNVNVPGSMCYDNNPANCNKYGRLYTWAAAMDSAGIVDSRGVSKGCGFGKVCRVASEVSKVLVRGACPEGWHLPRHDEWEILRRNVDVAVGNNVQITSTAGKELKSKSGWISCADGSSGNGSDSFGFAVLPAGYFENYDGRFVLQSSMARFWSSEEGGRGHARGWMFINVFKTFGFNEYSKGDAFSVRCLQDPNEKNRTSLQHSQTQPSKIVKIGDQVWMAENLNVETEESWCFNNDPANCEKYGRLYAWEVAKEICPSGWRLPRKKDFKILLNKVGSSEEERSKNLRTTSWNNGTDKYGFSVLPAGVYFNGEIFSDLGHAAFFWSSAEDHSYLIVGDNSSYIYLGGGNDGRSVRCIQDN